MSSNYHPESYWSDVALRTSSRPDGVIAGDDEPFYRYKRQKFIELLHQIDFGAARVLEIGCGPGGNLNEILKHDPMELCGADISQHMIDYARTQLPSSVSLHKTNGIDLPFEDQYFDIALTVTVLQHNTDAHMLHALMQSICRCTSGEVYLYERIEKTIKGDSLNMGRPVQYYSDIMKREGFQLRDVTFIDVSASYYMAGIVRKMLNAPNRKEAEPLSSLSLIVQQLLLPITKRIDPMIKAEREFAQLCYVRD